MSDHPSPLNQRVRRLLGTGSLSPAPERPAALNGHHGGPDGNHSPDTGALFESQITRLSQALRELHTIDRAREAELRQLRERLAHAEAAAHAQLVERLAPTIAQLDAMISEAARLLQPHPTPPPTATPFERMRARAAYGVGAPAPFDQARREALVSWASGLIDLRMQLSTLIDQ